MTLAIMSRATLGHTGRPLHASPLIVASSVLVRAAAVARSRGAPLAPAHARALLVISGALWSLAFTPFAIRLGSALVPRLARILQAMSHLHAQAFDLDGISLTAPALGTS